MPASLEELWPLMARHPEAMLYAGGTDVLVRIRSGLADPPALICLERIGALSQIREKDGVLWLGAGVSFHRVETSPQVRRGWPLLARAAGEVGSPQIRHMGTPGGNLGTASPAGDSLPALYALGAEMELASASGRRLVPVEEFITGPGRTSLKAGEIILSVVLPANQYNLQHFEKVGSRNSLAISIASLAVAAELSAGGVVEKIRLAWGSVGPRVVTSQPVEEFLTGRTLDAATLAWAGELAQQAATPINDLRAEASYRLALVKNLLLRLSA